MGIRSIPQAENLVWNDNPTTELLKLVSVQEIPALEDDVESAGSGLNRYRNGSHRKCRDRLREPNAHPLVVGESSSRNGEPQFIAYNGNGSCRNEVSAISARCTTSHSNSPFNAKRGGYLFPRPPASQLAGAATAPVIEATSTIVTITKRIRRLVRAASDVSRLGTRPKLVNQIRTLGLLRKLIVSGQDFPVTSLQTVPKVLDGVLGDKRTGSGTVLLDSSHDVAGVPSVLIPNSIDVPVGFAA